MKTNNTIKWKELKEFLDMSTITIIRDLIKQYNIQVQYYSPSIGPIIDTKQRKMRILTAHRLQFINYQKIHVLDIYQSSTSLFINHPLYNHMNGTLVEPCTDYYVLYKISIGPDKTPSILIFDDIGEEDELPETLQNTDRPIIPDIQTNILSSGDYKTNIKTINNLLKDALTK